MRLVQTMEPMLAPSLPVQIGISGSSACLQIDVISGARRNPQSNFENLVDLEILQTEHAHSLLSGSKIYQIY